MAGRSLRSIMRRPFGIKLTTTLMAIVVFLHLVAALASDLPRRWTISRGLFAFSSTAFGVAVAGVALVFFEFMVLWFYWNGRSWARWVVVVGCLLCFVSLRHFIVGPLVSHGTSVIIWYRIAVALVVLFYLSTQAGRAWFLQAIDLERFPPEDIGSNESR